jgi:hypothetical protein
MTTKRDDSDCQGILFGRGNQQDRSKRLNYLWSLPLMDIGMGALDDDRLAVA